jgi:hypothetical protein
MNQKLCFVYFARSGPFLKIGYSRNPKDRIKDIKHSFRDPLPEKPSLLGYIPGGSLLEGMLHAYFRPFKLKGYKEWFTAVQESVSKVDYVINYASGDPTIEQWCAFLGPKFDVQVNKDGHLVHDCPRALAFQFSLQVGYWLNEVDPKGVLNRQNIPWNITTNPISPKEYERSLDRVKDQLIMAF